MDVARGKNPAERIRWWGIGGEEWGEWVVLVMRRGNQRRRRGGGDAAAGDSCYDGGGGGGGCRSLGFAGRCGE